MDLPKSCGCIPMHVFLHAYIGTVYPLDKCTHAQWSPCNELHSTPTHHLVFSQCVFAPWDIYREGEEELEPTVPEMEDKVSDGEAPEETDLHAEEVAAAAEAKRREEVESFFVLCF